MENNTKNEEWRDVPDYEGYYQVSNLGRVRSLDRTVTYSDGRRQFYKGGAIKGSLSKDGYKQTTLSRNGEGRGYNFSQLVAMAFLGHKPNGLTLVVDHINGDKSDDRRENLRIVTNRDNCSTCFKAGRSKYSSIHTGVSWDKTSSKWRALIRFEGAIIRLGLFHTEVDASLAYQKALTKIKGEVFNPEDYVIKHSSLYRGVAFNKATKKWVSLIQTEGNRAYLGSFHTEKEAFNAYQASLLKIENGSFNPDDYKPKWTSEYKGVSFNKDRGKWTGRVTLNGRRMFLGYFPTEIEARNACKNKLKKLTNNK